MHRSAFGLIIKEKNIEAFIEYTNEKYKDHPKDVIYMVDFIYNYKHINPEDILEIGHNSGMWGQSVDEPLVVIENLPIRQNSLTLYEKGPTLKISLDNGINLIKFGVPEEEFDRLNSSNGEVIINVIGTCKANEWQGRFTPQIEIVDYEIIDRKEWVF